MQKTLEHQLIDVITDKRCPVEQQLVDVKRLMNLGAKPDHVIQVEQHYRTCALSEVRIRQLPILECLLSQPGLALNARSSSGQSVIDTAVHSEEMFFLLFEYDPKGVILALQNRMETPTALTMELFPNAAALQGNQRLLQWVFDHRIPLYCDYDRSHDTGNSTLSFALKETQSYYDYPVVDRIEWLLKHKAIDLGQKLQALMDIEYERRLGCETDIPISPLTLQQGERIKHSLTLFERGMIQLVRTGRADDIPAHLVKHPRDIELIGEYLECIEYDAATNPISDEDALEAEQRQTDFVAMAMNRLSMSHLLLVPNDDAPAAAPPLGDDELDDDGPDFFLSYESSSGDGFDDNALEEDAPHQSSCRIF